MGMRDWSCRLDSSPGGPQTPGVHLFGHHEDKDLNEITDMITCNQDVFYPKISKYHESFFRVIYQITESKLEGKSRLNSSKINYQKIQKSKDFQFDLWHKI